MNEMKKRRKKIGKIGSIAKMVATFAISDLYDAHVPLCSLV